MRQIYVRTQLSIVQSSAGFLVFFSMFNVTLRRQIIVGIMPTAVTFLHCSERQSIEVAYILQEAQPTQRNRAMLRVIEYFAKSLKGSQGHSK